jgi:hypothetical protein
VRGSYHQDSRRGGVISGPESGTKRIACAVVRPGRPGAFSREEACHTGLWSDHSGRNENDRRRAPLVLGTALVFQAWFASCRDSYDVAAEPSKNKFRATLAPSGAKGRALESRIAHFQLFPLRPSLEIRAAEGDWRVRDQDNDEGAKLAKNYNDSRQRLISRIQKREAEQKQKNGSTVILRTKDTMAGPPKAVSQRRRIKKNS